MFKPKPFSLIYLLIKKRRYYLIPTQKYLSTSMQRFIFKYNLVLRGKPQNRRPPFALLQRDLVLNTDCTSCSLESCMWVFYKTFKSTHTKTNLPSLLCMCLDLLSPALHKGLYHHIWFTSSMLCSVCLYIQGLLITYVCRCWKSKKIWQSKSLSFINI